jgi:hypothetical protein
MFGGGMWPNAYFYPVTWDGFYWYDNYRNKATLTSYDDKEKEGIDYR